MLLVKAAYTQQTTRRSGRGGSFWDYAPLLFNNPEINQKAGGIYE